MRSILARTDALKAIYQAEAKLVRHTARHLPLDSDTLFAGGSEVAFAHGAEIYRQRRARQNKLILTK